MHGVTITVLFPTDGGIDRFGNAAGGEPVRQVVEDVLVSPSSTEDFEYQEAYREHGDRLILQLHFPKTFSGDLRGAQVVLPHPWEGTYSIIGEPKPYIGANTPTRWHMPAKAVYAHG